MPFWNDKKNCNESLCFNLLELEFIHRISFITNHVDKISPEPFLKMANASWAKLDILPEQRINLKLQCPNLGSAKSELRKKVIISLAFLTLLPSSSHCLVSSVFLCTNNPCSLPPKPTNCELAMPVSRTGFQNQCEKTTGAILMTDTVSPWSGNVTKYQTPRENEVGIKFREKKSGYEGCACYILGETQVFRLHLFTNRLLRVQDCWHGDF